MASYASPSDDDKPGPSQDVATWLSEIAQAQKDMQKYDERCRKIDTLYRYEKSASSKKRQYQIFWANMETMETAVYDKAPKPVVASRFKSDDPTTRVVATLLERGLAFQIEEMNFHEAFEQVNKDYLLFARGVPRLRYEAEFEEAEIPDGLSDEEAGEDAEDDAEEAQGQDILKFENVVCDFVQRQDFIHPKARTWRELPWIAYRAFLTRAELKKRFPDCAASISLDASPARENDGSTSGSSNADEKATIYEIWDKTNRKVIWVAKGYDQILEEVDPYLKLKGFFPSPRPVYGTLSSDSLIPVPDYTYYQDQVQEIDDLTARIASLTDSLKLVGFYPAGPQGEGSPEIERAAMPGVENKMIAVKSWAAFKEGNSGGVPIVYLPVDQVAKIITECISIRRVIMDDVHQLTGISDLMRGDTDAQETMGAQKLKSQYGSVRTKKRQKAMARLIRDTVAMAGEILAEHFQIETLIKIAGLALPTQADVQMQFQQMQQQFAGVQQQWQQAAQQAQSQGQPPPPPPSPPQPPQVVTVEDAAAMLKDSVTRRFRLDIETDSTIASDQAQERADRTQAIASISQFLTAWGPIIQAKPELTELAGALLKFGLHGFPVARELEDIIDKMVDGMMAEAKQPRQPPQPSPEDQINLQTAQIKAGAEQSKAQIGVEAVKVKAQAEQAKAGLDVQQAREQHAMDTQRLQIEGQHMMAGHAMKQRTLEQQMQIIEQKAVARAAMAAVSPGPGANVL